MLETRVQQGRLSRNPDGPPPQDDWRVAYTHRLRITDLLAVVWAVIGTQLIWFGFDASGVVVESITSLAINYTFVSVIVAALWLAGLKWMGTRDHRVIGTEFTEYRRVVDASLRVFGAIAIAAYLLKIDLARGYFLTALPLGLIVILASRWMWRQWLRVQRRSGRYSFNVLIVGSAASAAHLAVELRRNPDAGFRVVGACIPNAPPSTVLAGSPVPVWSDLDDIVAIVAASGADTVAITSSDELPPDRVRQLSWSLEAGRQHIVVAPNLTDIAGPRIHTRPVAGLPLLHVETPRFEGGKVITKRIFDLLVSGALVLAVSPILLGIALLVKASSPGPVFYRQERIGQNGEPFGMLKFRSMRPNADKELAALLAAQGTSDKPLFKVQNDPRITPVGRVLRKYSLDELPQLLNVVLGDMSLVGPRPQISGEVALYDSAAERRLLLKPGMSGLWQVSGRSSLSRGRTLSASTCITWRTGRLRAT